MAKYMGKDTVIGETGAGQHGLALATACALMGLKCRIFMGEVDIRKQAINVRKMQLLGAEVVCVQTGGRNAERSGGRRFRGLSRLLRSRHLLYRVRRRPPPLSHDRAGFSGRGGKGDACAVQTSERGFAGRCGGLRRRRLERDRDFHGVPERRVGAPLRRGTHGQGRDDRR